MRHIVRTTALATLLLAAFPAAQAATQSYNFNGTIETGAWSYSGESFAGNFSFDDAALLGSGLEIVGLTGLSWNLHGNVYNLTTADAAPDVSYQDGHFLGLSYSSSPSTGPQVTLVAGSADSSGAFLTSYTPANVFGGNASIVYLPVPEPESYAMLLAGLGLIGLIARRRTMAG